MSGLRNICGHIIVYVKESAGDWAFKGTLLQEGLEKMANMFKIEFSRNYYKDMGQWLRMKTTVETPAKTKASYDSGRWDENPFAPWDPEDFETVTFEKTFEYDMFADAPDLLSHKSVIHDKESWGHEHDIREDAQIETNPHKNCDIFLSNLG